MFSSIIPLDNQSVLDNAQLKMQSKVLFHKDRIQYQ